MDIDPQIYAECLREERERYERLVNRHLDREERFMKKSNDLNFIAGLAVGTALVLAIGTYINYKEKNSD
jgi:hypothetical protein